jgi:hypothetical protein
MSFCARRGFSNLWSSARLPFRRFSNATGTAEAQRSAADPKVESPKPAKRPFLPSLSVVTQRNHSSWWRILDFAAVVTVVCVLIDTVNERYLPHVISGPRRSLRAAKIMATISIDYKFTYWWHPELSDKTLGDEALEVADRALSGRDLQEDAAQLTDEQRSMLALRSALHQRNADRLLHLLQRNKGLYIKVGQVRRVCRQMQGLACRNQLKPTQALSAMNHILPKEYTSTLRVLQDHAPSVSFDIVRNTIESELGATLESVFERFDQVPIASASLAQVHYAITRAGERVAVKVQYPELRQQFPGDMFVHKWTLRVADVLFSNFELAWSHEEIESNLAKEVCLVSVMIVL